MQIINTVFVISVRIIHLRGQKRPMLMINGYVFHHKNSTMQHDSFYCSSKRKSNCKVYAIKIKELHEKYIVYNGPHNHDPPAFSLVQCSDGKYIKVR